MRGHGFADAFHVYPARAGVDRDRYALRQSIQPQRRALTPGAAMWITRVSINNPVFATMVMVALCVLGLFSYAKLGVEQMPDITFPGAFVEVMYPGAAPEVVEREVMKPVEELLIPQAFTCR